MTTSSTAKVNVVVTDNGTIDDLNADATKLNANLNAAAKSAGHVPKALAAARAQMGAVADSAQEASTKASGLARSLSTGTGAAGRDFAKQAQGLGGLVQLYATYAANIFAVGAAFTALSRAADIANLTAGLQQLGAAAGQNLTFISQKLVEVTDGALNVADAMKAVAQASSAGISTENIERLGRVAKSASQALGVNLPDAVNRLTRGITKLEPELLDEIGIMVRLDDTTRKYAASIGKSALALTDFERRQAFANAVLEQGEQKFGAIELAANPYTKLLANIQNLAIEVGGGLNKVLGPVIDLLNSNPTALAAVIGALIAKILKQGIPALSTWRSKLEESAEAANQIKIDRYKEYEQSLNNVASAQGASAKAALEDAKAQGFLIREYNNRNRLGKALIGIEKEGVLNKEKAIALEKLAIETRRRSEGDLQTRIKNGTLDEKQIAARKQYLAAVDQGILGLRKFITEEERLAKIYEQDKANRTRFQRMVDYFGTEDTLRRRAEQAEKNSIRSRALANVSANAQTAGIIGALSLAYADLGKKGEKTGVTLGALGKGATLAWAGLAATITRVSTVLASLGGVMALIGIAVAALTLLNSWLSTNAKSSAALSDSIDKLNSSADLLSDTINTINKSGGLFSIQNIQARANAFTELATSIDQATEALKKYNEDTKKGFFSSIADKFMDSIGFGKGDEFSDSLTESINNALTGLKLDDVTAFNKLRQEIQKVAKVDPTNVEEFNSALRGMSNEQRILIAQRFSESFEKIREPIKQAADKAKEFSDALKIVSEKVTENAASLKIKGAEAEIGQALITAGINFSEAMESPTEKIAQFLALGKNVEALSIFPTEMAVNIANVAEEIDKYNKLLAKRAELEKSIAADQEFLVNRKSPDPINKEAQQRLELNKSQLEELNGKIALVDSNFGKRIDQFGDIGQMMFQSGITKLTRELSFSFREGAIVFNRGLSGILKSLGGETGVIEAKLSLEETAIERDRLKALYENNQSLRLLREAMDLNTLATREKTLKEEKEKAGPLWDTDEFKQQREELQKITNSIRAISVANEKLGSDRTKLKSINNVDFKDIDKAILPDVQRIITGVLQDNLGLAQGLATLDQKAALQKLTLELEGLSREANIAASSLQAGANVIGNELEILELQRGATSIYSEELQTRREALRLGQLQLTQAAEKVKDENNIAVAIKAQEAARKSGKADSIAEAERLVDKIRNDNAVNERRREQQRYSEAVALLSDRQSRENEARNRALALETEIFDLSQETSRVAIKNAEDLLSARESAGIVLEKDAANIKATLALKNLELETEKQLRDINISSSEQLRTKYEEIARLVASGAGADDPRVQTVYAEIDALNSAYIQRVKNAKQEAANRKAVINLTKAQEVAQAKYNEKVEVLTQLSTLATSAAQGLADVFGEIGEGIGELVTSFTTFAEKQAELEEKLRKSRQTEMSETDRAREERQIEAEMLDNKLSSYDSIAKASKKFFKEESAAYKALTKLEKVLAAVKLANALKEMYMEAKVLALKLFSDTTAASSAVTTAGVEMGATTAAATVDGQKSIINAGKSLPPPASFAAMAAMALAVGAILGKTFGFGKGSVPKGITAAEVQEVQGTGQAYNNGVLEDTGLGKLGSPKERSTAVEDSIDLIEKHTFEYLEYSNKMLDALKSIEKNTRSLAGALYVNSQFRNLANFKDVTSLRGIFSSVSSDGILGKVLGGIFGTKKTEQLDAGIIIKTNGAIAQLGQASVETYNVLQTTKKGFLGIGGSTKVKTETETINDPIIQRTASSIIGGMSTALIEAADVLGFDLAKGIIDSFDFNIKVSTKGLTGEEIAEAVLAQIGIELDRVSEKAFPELKRFQALGEDFATTVIRLARDSQLLGLSIKSSGLKFEAGLKSYKDAPAGLEQSLRDGLKGLGLPPGTVEQMVKDGMALRGYVENIGLATIGLEQYLIDLFGGIDNLLSKVDFFNKNFLTEAERLVPIKNMVVSTLDSLGLAFIDTREEFKTYVQALNLAIPEQAQLFKQLMDLAPAFAEVYKAADELEGVLDDLKNTNEDLMDSLRKLILTQQEYDAYITQSYTDEEKALYYRNQELQRALDILNKEEELLKRVNDLDVSILEAQGKTVEAIALKREKELEATDAVLRPLQMYIYAKEDELEAINKLNSIMSDLETEFNNVVAAAEQAAQNLKAATDNIVNGYKDAKTKYEDLLQEQEDLLNDQARELSDALKDIATSIREFIDSIYTTDKGYNTPTERFGLLQSQFSEEYTKAMAGDTEAAAKLTDIASELIDLGKETSPTELEFARIVGDVTSKLQDVESLALANILPDNDTTDSRLEDIKLEIEKAREDLAIWENAFRLIGSPDTEKTTEEIVGDYLKQWDDANKANIKAQKDVERAKEILEELGIDIPRAKTSIERMEDLMDDYILYSKQLEKARDYQRKNDLISILAAIDRVVSAISGISSSQNKPAIPPEPPRPPWDSNGFVIGPSPGPQSEADLAMARAWEEWNAKYGSGATSSTTSSNQSSLMAAVNAAAGRTTSTTTATKVSAPAPIPNPTPIVLAPVDNTDENGFTMVGGSGIPPSQQISVIPPPASSPIIDNKTETTPVSPTRETALSQAELDALYWQQRELDYYLNSFADGGLHTGGLRLVGENGPELEVTPPSRIFSNRDTQRLLNNDELIAEIRQLRYEISIIKYNSELTEQNTKKSADILVRVSENGDAVKTTAT